jgi:hypothetical protein
MTTKRDSKKKDEPKAANRPKLKKETLRDLAARDADAERLKGGGVKLCSKENTGCG